MLACHKTILYDGSSKVCSPDFNEDYILKSLSNLEALETEAYQFKKPQMSRAQESLITHIEIEPGKAGVLKKKEQLAEGLHLLHYQNGTRIILHDSNRDKILIKLLTKEGLNQVAEGDRYYYEKIVGNFFDAYGIYNSNEVYDLQKGFGIYKEVDLSEYAYNYSIQCKTENFEQALQVLNLSLTKPACPDNKELADRIAMRTKRKPKVDKGKEFMNQKSIQWLPAKPNSSKVGTIAERLFEHNKRLSTNLKNAVVFISGQLPENAEELAAQYIASVTPSTLPEKQVVKRSEILPKGVEANEFEWDRKLAWVGYLFTALPEYPLQLKDELMLEAISQYAFVKMVETIRDKYGLVYALGTTADVQTHPADYYSLSMRFMIDPKNVGLSKKVMREEVLTPMSEGRISKQEVEKIKAMIRNLFVMSFYEPKQMEGRWLEWTLKYDKVPSPEEINKLIDSISYSELQALMKKVVNTEAHFVSVRRPKNKK
jgi:predicted Zn-dependent peptidase